MACARFFRLNAVGTKSLHWHTVSTVNRLRIPFIELTNKHQSAHILWAQPYNYMKTHSLEQRHNRIIVVKCSLLILLKGHDPTCLLLSREENKRTPNPHSQTPKASSPYSGLSRDPSQDSTGFCTFF